MGQIGTTEATCSNCRRVYFAQRKRYYCDHCGIYYYVCPSCEERGAKCPHCGVPLKRKTEPLAKVRR